MKQSKWQYPHVRNKGVVSPVIKEAGTSLATFERPSYRKVITTLSRNSNVMVPYEKTMATGKLSQYTLYFVFTCLYLKNELADGD